MLLADTGAAGYWWVPLVVAVLGIAGEWTRRTVRSDREQAQEARVGTNEDAKAAEAARREADAVVRTLGGVIGDYQKQVEHCVSETTALREDNRQLRQFREEDRAEIQRLRGVIEGILRDRERDAQS